MSKLKVGYEYELRQVLFSAHNADDEVLDSRTYYLGDVHDNLQARIALYGLNKFLTDRTSSEKDKVTKLSSMDEYFGMLKEGVWAKERVVGAPIVSVAVEALAELEEMSIPDTQASLAQYDKGTRAQILGSAKVIAKAAAIIAERKEYQPKSLDAYKS